MTWPGSDAPKQLLPATMTLAPLSAAASMVLGPKPPSTSMSRVGWRWRRDATLGIMSDMNFWPPKPGSTVMTRAILV